MKKPMTKEFARAWWEMMFDLAVLAEDMAAIDECTLMLEAIDKWEER